MGSIVVLSLGGTIASVPQEGAPGSVPALTAQDLVAAVPALAAVGQVEAASFRQVPSVELRVSDILALRDEAVARVDAGAAGLVVTTGTDSLEEVAFLLDLVYDLDAPIVVTGAMRSPGLPGADGPANLLAAARVAASPQAAGLGPLVVLGDEIHAARFVHKSHTTSPATFRSPLLGPIGWVAEDRVRIPFVPRRHRIVSVDSDAEVRRVALLKAGLGDDPTLVGHLVALGYEGAVVETMGAGHLPARWVDPLAELARRIPVVFVSRTGSGEQLRRTYGFPGSEQHLTKAGLINGGVLDGLKARLLLTVLLTAGAPRNELSGWFADLGYGG